MKTKKPLNIDFTGLKEMQLYEASVSLCENFQMRDDYSSGICNNCGVKFTEHKQRMLSKKDFSEKIEWSQCPTHCGGGQHVARSCHYMVGEVKDIGISIKLDAYRSVLQNKQVVLDALYQFYLDWEDRLD